MSELHKKEKHVSISPYVFLKWSNNTTQERSERKKRVKQEENIVDIALMEGSDMCNNVGNDLDSQNMITDIDRLVPNGFVKQNNKRDGQNEKLLSRGMMIQKSINPFLGGNNYLKDLDTEDTFLRPKDSNF